jgi:nucleoside phosphorylase
MSAEQPKQVDLAIVTALREELEPVLHLLGGAEAWKIFTLGEYIHYSAQFACGPHTLNVVAGWLWKYGGDATVAEVLRLKHIQPELIVMTGICAGWHAKDIALGDVIVADRAFHAGEGKQTRDGLKADIRTFQPPPWLLQWMMGFAHDQRWNTTITTPRPPSLDYQAEWLLCQIAKCGAVSPLNDAEWEELRTHGILYRQAKQRLQEEKLLSSTGKPTKQGQKQLDTLRQHNYGKLAPTPDRTQARVHYGAFASTEAVVAVDAPFQASAEHVRKVLAIDLEVASLFAAEVGVPAFAVKGVSDYGTPQKDDAFHAYAAEASARWMHAFICHNAPLLVERRPKVPATSVGASSSQGPIAKQATAAAGSPASITQEDIDTQQALLRSHRQTLSSYLMRLAIVSSAFATPELSSGIREARNNIRRCKAILRTWGVQVDDYPDDEEHYR